MIIRRTQFSGAEWVKACGHRGQDAYRATDDYSGNGSTPPSHPSLMITSGRKSLFKGIVGGGQVSHVVAVEQSRCKVLGDLAKMINSFAENPDAVLLGVHLLQ